MNILDEIPGDYERADALVNLLIDRATGGPEDDSAFFVLRSYFLEHERYMKKAITQIITLLSVICSCLNAEEAERVNIQFSDFSYKGFKCKDCNKGVSPLLGDTFNMNFPVGSDVYQFQGTPLEVDSGLILKLALKVSVQDPENFDPKSMEDITRVGKTGEFTDLGTQNIPLKENRSTSVTYNDLNFKISILKNKILREPEFEVVKDADGDVISGTVVMYFWINVDGKIESLNIAKTDNELLSKAALKGMEKLLYDPPLLDGVPNPRVGYYTAEFGK